MSWEDYVRPWASIAKGAGVAFKQMVSPSMTVLYPNEDTHLSRRWRGPLRLRGVMDDLPPPVTDAPPLEFPDLMNELHEDRLIAPCQGGCPANVDARGQNALVAAGRPVEAYEVVRRRNILPGVLGYTCPAPCEDVCRRSYLDDPVAIRMLHRDCYEVYDREVRRPDFLQSLVHREEHVAVIGAGPAGLAVAFDLVQMGHRVTIYERESVAGGIPATGIPLYRLDRTVLNKEIDDLLQMGIGLKLGVEVGRDVTLQELHNTHDAVVVAAGYSGGRIVPISGSDAEGVLAAVDFLHAYCVERSCRVGPKVVVVGGGDVSCDCSRSSLRCGSQITHHVHRESRAEMPADEREVHGAEEEGVVFLDRWEPQRILVEDGKTTGIEFRKILSLLDKQGRHNPQLSEETLTLPADTVIFAVGQSLQLDFLAGSDAEMDKRGRPITDETTGACNVPGLFFAGDVVTGPKLIITAMGQAHETAISVHRYLEGLDLHSNRKPPVHPPLYYMLKLYAPSPDEAVGEGGPGGRRVPMPLSNPMTRARTGKQWELGWSKGDGHREAIRCMRCQTHVCVACTMCARVCPDFCIEIEGYDTGYERIVAKYDFVMEWCCFCGLCQDICPTQTLSLAPSFDYTSPERRSFFYDRDRMLRSFLGSDEMVNKDGWP